jgi:hypothetical protein
MTNKPSTPYDDFLNIISTQMREEKARAQRADDERERKSLELIPIRQFFSKLVSIGVVVTHSAKYNGKAAQPPQLLEPFENETSPRWAPGVSIFLDHPAAIEIAIPNYPAEGVVHINVSSAHPRAELLRGPFSDMDEACRALSRFLALDTARVERPPLNVDISD